MSDVRQCDHCHRVAAPDDSCWLQLGKAKQAHGLFQAYASGMRNSQDVHLCSWVCVMDYANLYVLDPSPEEAT